MCREIPQDTHPLGVVSFVFLHKILWSLVRVAVVLDAGESLVVERIGSGELRCRGLLGWMIWPVTFLGVGSFTMRDLKAAEFAGVGDVVARDDAKESTKNGEKM